VAANHYSLIKVSRDATVADIEDAWREEHKKWSNRSNNAPRAADRLEANQRVEELASVKAILTNPARRAEYDRSIGHPPEEPKPKLLVDSKWPKDPSDKPDQPEELEVPPVASPSLGMRRIRDSHVLVKLRNPWAVALLPFVTLGIYHLVWWYRVNRELRDFGRARGHDLGQSPTRSLLAIYPGVVVVVPALITYWRGTKRIQAAAHIGGREPVSGWTALVLYLLLSPAFNAYLQVSLNDLWRSEAEPLPLPPS
jgi:Domain of unknown function (DUF4234)